MDGPSAKVFYAWCAIRRHLRDRIIMHENVPNFLVSALQHYFSKHYIVDSVICCMFS